MAQFKPLKVWIKGCWKLIQTQKEWKKYLKDKKAGDGPISNYISTPPPPVKSVPRGTVFGSENLVPYNKTKYPWENSYYSYKNYVYKPEPPYIPISYKTSGKTPKLLTEKQINKLKEICQKPIQDFAQKGWKTVKTENGLNYYYLDRGSQILAVAHLDYVCRTKKFVYEINNKNQEIVWCPQLDDRLGAWVILERLFNELNYDILLCDGEETGRSTARYFNEKPKGYYNWIFEFDRAKTDVVLYNYSSPEFIQKLESVGFEIGRGIFSDISCLEGLGCKAMNIGVGYRDYHSEESSAPILDTLKMIKKFKKFYKTFCNTHLEHEKLIVPSYEPQIGKYAKYKYGKLIKELEKDSKLSDEEWWKKHGSWF